MSVRILFVCLGNICRSPTAEGVFRQRAAAAGLSLVKIDSAGTAGWHVGKAPDARTVKAAARRGYDLSMLRARQVGVDDFNAFDFILAMDEQNLAELRSIQPAQSVAELGLFLEYAEGPVPREVPDPYYGGDQGFQTVLDLVESASDGLIRRLRGVGS
ncbi:low molecular weight protein-tyrosine-phosphatase [Alcanivorax sp. 1008]|uniref:low molecular weight protein-tyrosine-phosphatase n=1 Tax=Alcanivorax sp. 1008 TaxID=2816853 RepID=UPI001DD222A5|nr:low molecular weight protein-tyrosine-phosphatase [Alcanivorax sp. 1008]MCC1496308.1 low molecular weight phosphotyrosine protein phosphatase [Alcanivorax sp. 1008]